MDDREEKLAAREEALARRERELEERERSLSPLSRAVKTRKEQLYDKVKLTTGQLDWIIRITWVLLGIVAVLIILEAAGIFKLS